MIVTVKNFVFLSNAKPSGTLWVLSLVNYRCRQSARGESGGGKGRRSA